MHQSVATISNPEFINLQPLDISPLMSKCEIKVLYLGQNRNLSYIDKETAAEMAKSLRGAPIVGWFKEEKEDFRDHGEALIIEDGEFKIDCKTKPYGFVSPDAQVWFQDFEDFDDFGNSIVRTYLMTTGYLWTGQFEECKLAVEEGRPQSMELDEKTLQGHWSNDLNSGMEFFIINDAIFSKLCILGDDVEPCFEGASVTAPEVSTNFTNDKSFRKTLFTMMQELYSVLEGGKEIMENEVIVQDNIVQEEPTDFQVNTEDTPVVEEEPVVEETPAEDFTAAEEEPVVAEEPAQEVTPEPEVEPAPAENYEEKYTALEKEYNELQEKYSALEKEKEELVAFKSKIEDAQKDELIEKFSMVSDEDKKDIIENKSQYTLEEIESKLSVICFRKQINFSANVVEQPAEEEKPVVSFNLNTSGNGPDWLSAVDKTIAKKG